MKLELKHLAPYLPYELKVLVFDFDKSFKEEDTLRGIWFNSTDASTNNWIVDYDHDNYTGINKIKPILRPLSDLTKEIEHNGEKFAPVDKLDEEFYAVTKYSQETATLNFDDGVVEINLLAEPLEIIEKLFEWHFDVFGLIEKGLAIDKNTL